MYRSLAYVTEDNDIVYLEAHSGKIMTFVAVEYIEDIQKRSKRKITMNNIFNEARGELEEYIRNQRANNANS